jgi:hypothetical protein
MFYTTKVQEPEISIEPTEEVDLEDDDDGDEDLKAMPPKISHLGRVMMKMTIPGMKKTPMMRMKRSAIQPQGRVATSTYLKGIESQDSWPQ